MKLSVVIPAHNEEAIIERVIMEILRELEKESIDNEIIVVDDNSTDGTANIIDRLSREHGNVKAVHRKPPKGFGRAIREGIEIAKGDVIVTAMGDASDDPKDIVKYFRKIEEGYDCVFGSRFIKGASIKDYPPHKLFVNRLANTFLMCLFWTKHNDLTNAFKAYRKEVIEAIKPIESLYYNITIELPLKALIRNFSIATVPINWYGRESGVSKLKIQEMGRRYLYIALYLWLQRTLIMDDIRERQKCRE
ncbi:MAG: glycosyltransferase family 2 protein [Candidatus Omnitrophota bacterium]